MQLSKTAATVGRIVWFWVCHEGVEEYNFLDTAQAFKASVICVNADGSVELEVSDHRGCSTIQRDVKIYEPHEDMRHGHLMDSYATWMPYQSKQHEKDHAEQLSQSAGSPLMHGREPSLVLTDGKDV